MNFEFTISLIIIIITRIVKISLKFCLLNIYLYVYM
jgi:hypothetical protein